MKSPTFIILEWVRLHIPLALACYVAWGIEDTGMRGATFAVLIAISGLYDKK